MANQIPKRVINEIHNTIKYVWEYDISSDYERRLLFREDTLKNSIYFHLRTRLESLFQKYGIVIFTEYNTEKFSNKGYRADIVIAQIDPEGEEFIKEYIAVFELKFKADYSKAAEDISYDYNKTERYIKEYGLGDKCKYYVAAIWECLPDSKWWLDKNTKWAKGKLTELNADYDAKGNMAFYVRQH